MSRLPSATQILIDRCSEAALVHERGVVVMANHAAARLLRLPGSDELIGRDLASVLCLPPARYGEVITEVRTSDGQCLPVCVREHPLVADGKVQRALLLRPVRPALPSPSLAVAPLIREVLESLRSAVHAAAGQCSLHVPREAHVVGDAVVLRGLVGVLVLDAISRLDPAHAGHSELAVDVVVSGDFVELAVEARGLGAVLPAGTDSFGVALARVAAAVLGAELHEDAAGASLRRVIVHLIRAGEPARR